MEKVKIIGAGGVAGIGMTRCLNEDYSVLGEERSDWAKKMMECHDCDILHCVPDMIIPVPDSAVNKYAGNENCFLPPKEEIELCQDKDRCADVLKELAPKRCWVRDTHGAGGSGAQMSQEYCPGRNFSCEMLYNKGKLIGYFIKERLSYQVKEKDLPLDKRGSSAVSVCVNDKRILNLSKKAIKRISKKPHGVYALDFKENEDGVPKITEINPGRFLTASYVYFYETNYNLPLAMVHAYFGKKYKLGQYPEGVGVIRQTDCAPYVGKL